MAHFAKIENNIVTKVIVAESASLCEELFGGEWIQTSYNTRGNEHKLGGTPLHKNFAGIGYTWDGTGFFAPKCHDVAVLNTETYIWNCDTCNSVTE